MTREEAIAKLKGLEPELRQQGVLSLFLFGSTAKDSAGPESDVDLFFDDNMARPLSLFGVIGIQHFLQDTLGVRVDLMTRDCLHPLLRREIEAEAVHVF
ncbi:MAG: nucleotidyltransferase family protein [Pseudomonadota bacterium]